MAFPIEALRSCFFDLPLSKPIVLTADTGSGKSTHLPIWAQERVQGRVLVVEPRRIACQSLATWIQKQHPHLKIDYTIRFQDFVCEKTQIGFVPPQVALQYYQQNRWQDWDYLIIDEFHERTLEQDLILALLRTQKKPYLLMSATLTAVELAQQLQAELLQGEGRSFQVELIYQKVLGPPSPREVSQRVEQAIREHFPHRQGDALVFLPGWREMQQCAQSLRFVDRQQIHFLHGSLPLQDQLPLFEKSPQPRIILSTNVAESSLTLPYVTLVVDSGLVRQKLHRSGYSALVTNEISTHSADQRKGRAGRVCDGKAVRCWSEQYPLKTFQKAEIQRLDLNQILLQSLSLEAPLQELPLLTQPPSFALQESYQRLEEWGLVDSDKQLTPCSKEVLDYPLDLNYARLLKNSPSPPLLRTMLALGASFEHRQDPLKTLDKVHENERTLVFQKRQELSPTPLLQQAHLLTQKKPDPLLKVHQESFHWCRKIYQQLLKIAKLKNSSTELANSDQLLEYLMKTAPDLFYLKRSKRLAYTNGFQELRVRDLPPKDPPSALLILQIFPRQGKALQVELWGSQWIAFPQERLLQHPHIEQEFLAISDPKEHLVEVCWSYAGTKLKQETLPVESTQLVATYLAHLLLSEQSPLAGLKQKLTQELRLTQIYQELEPDEKAISLLDPLGWLESELKELGVSSPQDLELLQESDLIPQVIPYYLRESLAQDYPQHYLPGPAVYEVHYFPLQKRVEIHWKKGHKNYKPQRHLLPRWNGWKVEMIERGRKERLR